MSPDIEISKQDECEGNSRNNAAGPGHMRPEYGFEVYEENAFPLAYLITFRTFGTWLHGDSRGSVKRDGLNRYGTMRIETNPHFETWARDEMRQGIITLNDTMRVVVDSAIRDACERRGFGLPALNVRTNHAHVVVSAALKPERIADALKANATRMLRNHGLVAADQKVWSRGRSRRYLWKPRHVQAAIEYTVNGQGDEPFVLTD